MQSQPVIGLYTDKNPTYYDQPRQEVFKMIPRTALRILDVGCGAGTLSAALKRQVPGRTIYGIELDVKSAETAALVLDKVYSCNIEDALPEWGNPCFDTVIMADVIEHLVDPWKAVQHLKKFISDDGILVASVPNVRCWKVWAPLIFFGQWEYRNWGLLDKGHLRFFTRSSILKLFSNAGMEIKEVRHNIFPNTLSQIANILTMGFLTDLLTPQYLVVAKNIKT